MNKFLKFIRIIETAPAGLKRRLWYIFLFLFLLNAFVWIHGYFNSGSNPALLGLITLAYGLGLRHAVDADHIAAIDNTMRRLIQDGQKPVGVGLFFSLGHSTVVIVFSLLAAYFGNFIKNSLPFFQNTGAVIGTSISAFFLILIGIINLIVLIDIFKMMKKIDKGQSGRGTSEYFHKGGFIVRLLNPVLKTIKKSSNMYLVGFLFGLSLDTAGEVALLSLSAATGAAGIDFGQVIILPLAFTAGMTLLDSLDGILMLGAYGWAEVNPLRKIYYNMTITLISVFIALFIGIMQAVKVVRG